MKWFALLLVVSMPALANIAPPFNAPGDAKPEVAPEVKPEAPAEAKAEVAAEPAPTAAQAAPAAEHPGGNETAPGMKKEHPGGNANAPGMPPMQMMGVIEGGWAYVYAAWGAGVLGLLLYGASLFIRRSETPPPGAP